MRSRQRRGLLIVFEGTDGTGKTTQLEFLKTYLSQKSFPVITTREPTDGRYGQEIRQLYKNRRGYSREKELELFLNDRRDHVTQLLAPALEAGKIILCDRYFLSTAAYQGAIGFNPEEILELNSFAPEPDIALLFRMPLDKALTRITENRGDTLNDFEQKESLKKVSAIFDSIERSYIYPIDASGSPQEVFQNVLSKISPMLETFTTEQV